MACEAQKYWSYSRACILQAREASTDERRSRLLELARTWTEAAIREELNARGPIFAAVHRKAGAHG